MTRENNMTDSKPKIARYNHTWTIWRKIGLHGRQECYRCGEVRSKETEITLCIGDDFQMRGLFPAGETILKGEV